MIEPRSLRTAVLTIGWDMPSSCVPLAFWAPSCPNRQTFPSIVVKYLAEQLEIPDVNCLGQYRERLATHHAHAREIWERHGYRDFAEEPVGSGTHS
jgi:hypothetical protein